MQEEDDNNYQPVLPGAEIFTYKTIDTTNMRLNVFYPRDHKQTDSTPCIIFFFAGAFIHGSPSQYLDHCRYLSARGMVAISADYRVISRNKTTANECVYDAKDCIRWVRSHATELGINPDKIVVGGGSAGGLLAIECGMNDTNYDDPAGDNSVSCVPDALVLFNPVVNSEEFKFRIQKFKTDPNAKNDETSKAKEINPLTHVKGGMPPAIMFHGTEDDMSAFKFAQEFVDKMKADGNEIEFHSYEGMEHGFAQPNRHDGQYYRETLRLTDVWLTHLGYLEGQPSL